MDLDATDDPLHGQQEGRFFHGYYSCYCYLPLYVFCGRHLLAARLRSSNIDASAGAVEEMARIIERIRQLGRGCGSGCADSGFAHDELMAWCEANRVDDVFGLARHARLVAEVPSDLAVVAAEQAETDQPAQRFKEFFCATLDSWSYARRVIGNAEHLAKVSNPRFVVTSLPASAIEGRVQRADPDLQAARRGDPGAVPGDRHPPAQVWRPGVREYGGPGARAGAVDRGRAATDALVAHVLVGKYADHLPLYRQSQIYARQGIELDRSTLADWVGRAAADLRPLHERLFEHLKRSPKLFMDETRAPVLDPGRKRTKSGYLWAIARDDRPWAGPDPRRSPLSTRTGAAPSMPSGRWPGSPASLQVDAYAGLPGAGRARTRWWSGDAGLALVPRPAPVLRDRPRRRRPDRQGSPRAHRRPRSDREHDPR